MTFDMIQLSPSGGIVFLGLTVMSNSCMGDKSFITPNIYFAQVTMTLQLEQMKLLCPILYSVHVFYVCFSQVLFLLFFFFFFFFEVGVEIHGLNEHLQFQLLSRSDVKIDITIQILLHPYLMDISIPLTRCLTCTLNHKFDRQHYTALITP